MIEPCRHEWSSDGMRCMHCGFLPPLIEEEDDLSDVLSRLSWSDSDWRELARFENFFVIANGDYFRIMTGNYARDAASQIFRISDLDKITSALQGARLRLDGVD